MIREDLIIKKALDQAGLSMLARAKTAPKTKGVDHLEYILLEKEDFPALVEEMEKLGREHDVPFFIRDAKNLEKAQMLLLIGAFDEARNIPCCGLCGYEDCTEKKKEGGRCVFPLLDLGVALGSAVSLGQTLGVDSRIMMSAGKAALNLDYFENPATIAIAIPLSFTGKSIFFDRATS
ncbi:MAG TPA: DUF2148 domain-containing protein [Clostridia bacterium]|nr:DUF2148 domain-containing protein [Clostridia bacterium]